MTELIAWLDTIEVLPAWVEDRVAEWWKLHRPLETTASARAG